MMHTFDVMMRLLSIKRKKNEKKMSLDHIFHIRYQLDSIYNKMSIFKVLIDNNGNLLIEDKYNLVNQENYIDKIFLYQKNDLLLDNENNLYYVLLINGQIELVKITIKIQELLDDNFFVDSNYNLWRVYEYLNQVFAIIIIKYKNDMTSVLCNTFSYDQSQYYIIKKKNNTTLFIKTSNIAINFSYPDLRISPSDILYVEPKKILVRKDINDICQTDLSAGWNPAFINFLYIIGRNLYIGSYDGNSLVTTHIYTITDLKSDYKLFNRHIFDYDNKKIYYIKSCDKIKKNDYYIKNRVESVINFKRNSYYLIINHKIYHAYESHVSRSKICSGVVSIYCEYNQNIIDDEKKYMAVTKYGEIITLSNKILFAPLLDFTTPRISIKNANFH